MVFLATLATEMNRIESLVPIAREKLLPAQIQVSLAFRLQGGIERIGARNELVQAEGEKRFSFFVPAAIGSQQETLQIALAFRFWQATFF